MWSLKGGGGTWYVTPARPITTDSQNSDQDFNVLGLPISLKLSYFVVFLEEKMYRESIDAC